jgi:hypothetical protein
MHTIHPGYGDDSHLLPAHLRGEMRRIATSAARPHNDSTKR